MRIKTLLSFAFLNIVFLYSCSNEPKLENRTKNSEGLESSTESSSQEDSLKLSPTKPDKPPITDTSQFSTREYAQKIVDGIVNPTDDAATFEVLEALLNCAPEEEEFYLIAFDTIMSKSDGALSEALGSYGIKYIQNRPEGFVQYIANADSLCLDRWANYSAYELYFSLPDTTLASVNETIKPIIEPIQSVDNNSMVPVFEQLLLDHLRQILND